MSVSLTFRGDQVGVFDSVDDDGSGNTTYSITDTPFEDTDLVIITISDDSFGPNGEFVEGGDIVYESVQVVRDGEVYDLAVDSGSKIKESGGGSNKEQGDSFFQTNDKIGPADSGPFSDIPEEQYVFVTNTTLTAGQDVTISQQSGDNPNSNFDTSSVDNNPFICFLRGTEIETPAGPVPVEHLAAGDLVLTLDDGPQPIRWIHARRLFSPAPEHLPICIQRDCFGEDLPFNDLWVSPQHRVMLSGPDVELNFGEHQVLASAKSLLINRHVVQKKPPKKIDYYHLCFDKHQIIWSNGLLTESYYPGETSFELVDYSVRQELRSLFPDLAGDEEDCSIKTARPVLRAFETQTLASFGPAD